MSQRTEQALDASFNWRARASKIRKLYQAEKIKVDTLQRELADEKLKAAYLLNKLHTACRIFPGFVGSTIINEVATYLLMTPSQRAQDEENLNALRERWNP